MNRLQTSIFTILFAILAVATAPARAASVDPELTAAIEAAPLALTPVVITYQQAPTSTDLGALQALGITGGVVLNELPMVLTVVNKAQFDALRRQPGVLSLFANHVYEPYTNVSRKFIGAEALRADTEVTAANGGLPVSGRGIGVAVVDTGIDATHPDLQLGRNVVQNVFFPLAEVPLSPPAGFVPPVFVEQAPISDVEGGHGTFVAGSIGATGQASGDFYGGVAPGASLIGLVAGNDAGLSTFAIVQAYDYILTHQSEFNIRVANNSFGSDLGSAANYNPFDPINVGTRMLHDRFVTVVYAAGNSGDAPGAINRLSVAPWVISVAAGEKQGLGSPAGFSSRGEDDGTGTDTPGQPADPLAPPNLRPDLIAPGNNIKSTRSKGPGVTNFAGTALLQDLDIPPGFLPFYTTSQGTSFASPHVAGVVALMIEANPMLTPDEVVTILRQTSTPMPFPERVVGAGYVDAHNAVRAAMSLAAVPHPADLFPQPGGPAIVDPTGDQIGTTAQDIVSADFRFDAAANQIVYDMELADLSTVAPGMRWTQSSVFDGIRVFVSTSVVETTAVEADYGTIAPDPNTGVNTQTTIGPADSVEIAGNRVLVRLGLDKIDAAVGFGVLDTVSTATQAQAQILIGTSLTGGLLLNSDSATGSDFRVGDEPDGEDGNGSGEPGACTESFQERLPGAILAGGDETTIGFVLRCANLEAQINFHPGNQAIDFELLAPNGQTIARGEEVNGRRIHLEGLAPGEYAYRVGGTTSKDVDFVIRSVQSP
jgi:subtilisin family serine protease